MAERYCMRGQQQQQPNSGLDIVYIAAFFMLSGLGLWYFYGNIISRYVLYVRYYEALGILAVLTPIDNFLSALNLPDFELDTINVAVQEILAADPNSVDFQLLNTISNEVGQYLVFPSIVVGVLAGMHLLFFKAGVNFREKYSMQSLRQKESINWPEIMPVLRTDLIKAKIDDPPWGMSLQPLNFAKKYDLLKRVVIDHKPRVQLIKERAYGVFANQLGRRWSSLQNLKPHELALFAVCIARIGGDAVGARNYLQQMSSSSLSGKPNLTGAYQLMKKHVSHKAVSRAISPHAYVLTALASLIQVARLSGVLATAEFLWLKTVDRRMWYMLSSVGRQTPFPEVSGAFAHWIVEKRLRRPLKAPMVMQAVEALDVAISDILYNPDEQ